MVTRSVATCLAGLLSISPARAAGESLTLRAAVDAALRHHPVLDRVTADSVAAAARVGRARAPGRPRIFAAGSFRDDHADPVDASDAKPVTFGNDAVYNLGLTIQQLVTDSGVTRNQIEGAEAAARQTRGQIAVTRLDIELAVVEAYLAVLQGRELSVVSTGAIALVEQQLARATALFRATLRPEIDVLSARTQLAQARLARLRDDNNVATAKALLQNAIGMREPEVGDVSAIAIAPLPDEGRPIRELAALGLTQRAELAMARDGVAAAEARVRVGHGRNAPVVSVEAGVYASGGRSEHAPPSTAWTPGAGGFASLSMSLDLYTGGATRYEIEDAQAQVRSARAELERTEQAIALSVSQAALGVRISREAFANATGWREQAERQLQLAQARYQSGVGNFVELNDARTGLVNAQRQEVQARYDLANSRIALARELGRSPAELATP
jgi:outer membrane protein